MLELFQMNTEGITLEDLDELVKDEDIYCFYILNSDYVSKYELKYRIRIRPLKDMYEFADPYKRMLLRNRLRRGETLLIWLNQTPRA